MDQLNIGIIGDFDPDKAPHAATYEALKHAADFLAVKVNIDWLPTPALLDFERPVVMANYDAIWASPGSPESMDGAIMGIKRARLLAKPFLGT